MLRRIFFSVLFLAGLASVLYFWTPSRHAPIDPQSQQIASQALEHVRVIPQRVRILGYERTKFGNGWGNQVGEAGEYCSTRHFVLNQSFDTVPDEPCPRAIGTAPDEFTGLPVTPQGTDIDHIFPLSAAWDMGAHSWSDERRYEFANDWELNLAVTASEVNREKSDSMLEDWLPPLPRARCPYVARFLVIAAEYDLAVTEGDVTAAQTECDLDVT